MTEKPAGRETGVPSGAPRHNDPSRIAAQDASWVMNSLEADQLASAKAAHYPLRKLKRGEVLLFWGIIIGPVE